MKYEMKSMNEKLDILIRATENHSETLNKDTTTYDIFQLDSLLPIENSEKLDEIENKLSMDKNYRNQLVC